ncbi:unnamed protein product, partial [Caenorhabditis bovis]
MSEHTRKPLPIRQGRELDRPRWTVTRREETRHSPSRPTSPFQSRSVTTTERVHIVQLPVTDTSQAEGIGLIGAVTASGVPLHNGIIFNRDTKQTTTIITTTTTTYKILEVSDSDSLSDDYEMVDDNTLTIDVDLTERVPSPNYVIVSKSETNAPMSPITKASLNIDLEIPPRISETQRHQDIEDFPITSIVNVYHCGHTDNENSRMATMKIPIYEESQYVANDEQTASTSSDGSFEYVE